MLYHSVPQSTSGGRQATRSSAPVVRGTAAPTQLAVSRTSPYPFPSVYAGGWPSSVRPMTAPQHRARIRAFLIGLLNGRMLLLHATSAPIVRLARNAEDLRLPTATRTPLSIPAQCILFDVALITRSGDVVQIPATGCIRALAERK